MGEVVLATDRVLGRKVAIKRIRPELVGRDQALSRFQAEAKAVAALNHPQIVQVYDYGRSSEGHFIVMEYVDGENLAQRIERSGPLSVDDVIKLGGKLCGALDYAHSQGVVHRDIKPANVLISERGTPKLTDFGLARWQSKESGNTQTGVLLGTLEFMSPEQQKDASGVDARSDLWSLGATLYQACTGTSLRMMRAERIPETLRNVLLKSMEDDPAKRFQTAKEFAQALATCRGMETSRQPSSRNNTSQITKEAATASEEIKQRASDLIKSSTGKVTPVQSPAASNTAVPEKPSKTPPGKSSKDSALGMRQHLGFLSEVGRNGRWLSAGIVLTGLVSLSLVVSIKLDLWWPGQGKGPLSNSAGDAGDRPSHSQNRDPSNWRKLRVFQGHSGLVTSVALSRDGSSVLTGSDDNTGILWNVKTGEKIRTFEENSGLVISVVFSPDGTGALIGSYDKKAILWDTATGKQLRTYQGHTDRVYSVAFSPDGTHVLTGSADDTAILWNAESGVRIHTLKGHRANVNSVAFSRDGRRILTGSDDKTAILWNAASGERLQTFRGHADWIYSVALSSDGTLALTGSTDKTAILWNATTGERLRTFQGHTDFVTSVAFSPDDTQIVTGSWDKTAIVWNVLTGEQLLRLEGHTDKIYSVAFSSDGTHILTGSRDKTAILWGAPAGTPPR